MKRIIAYAALLLVLAGCGGAGDAGSDLVGLWVGVGRENIQITLNDDATGMAVITDLPGWEDAFEWRVEGDQLCITETAAGREDCAAYELDGDRLALEFDGTRLAMARWPGE